MPKCPAMANSGASYDADPDNVDEITLVRVAPGEDVLECEIEVIAGVPHGGPHRDPERGEWSDELTRYDPLGNEHRPKRVHKHRQISAATTLAPKDYPDVVLDAGRRERAVPAGGRP